MTEALMTQAFTKQVEDLGAVLDALEGCRVGYAGHSMGAAVGVLRACRDPRLSFLISLAGMVHAKAFSIREFGNVKPGEGCMWDEPSCPLSSSFMVDLAHVDSVVSLAPQIRIPWLLIHGTEDDVVPVQDSRDIFARANEPKNLIEIKGSNHVFAGEHTATMVESAVGWIRTRVQC